ncbi:hypothetical protein PSACC_02443 [Paramicrosporidium saccamoebae]|uniref:L-serine-phosphatidylethanolamine phosphatidyltransferase n=1 Tax=Paramicrosporidium saccamoebae TaxID=1246581 RepID=A0A2H9TJ04_9FUNG|nr:hypothetical protein PSACC_02443 [Paramicrosporidium saccamoebae]
MLPSLGQPTMLPLTTLFGTLSYRVLMCSGIAVAALFFVFYGMTQLRDGPFIRPHPVFWRAVQAISVIYLMFLIYIFFQNLNDARKLVAFIDPALGVPLQERAYADDCRLKWSSIYQQLDVFVAAHTFGWFGKALILRDEWLCWIVSVMFEVMEYSLQHQLPNFAECWWDHWILDVLICNWLGIWAGMKTCKYLAMKTYNWRSIRDIPGMSGKMRRTFGQFTPHSWVSFDWAAAKSFKGYCVVLIVTIFVTVPLRSYSLVPGKRNECLLSQISPMDPAGTFH